MLAVMTVVVLAVVCVVSHCAASGMVSVSASILCCTSMLDVMTVVVFAVVCVVSHCAASGMVSLCVDSYVNDCDVDGKAGSEKGGIEL